MRKARVPQPRRRSTFVGAPNPHVSQHLFVQICCLLPSQEVEQVGKATLGYTPCLEVRVRTIQFG